MPSCLFFFINVGSGDRINVLMTTLQVIYQLSYVPVLVTCFEKALHGLSHMFSLLGEHTIHSLWNLAGLKGAGWYLGQSKDAWPLLLQEPKLPQESGLKVSKGRGSVTLQPLRSCVLVTNGGSAFHFRICLSRKHWVFGQQLRLTVLKPYH